MIGLIFGDTDFPKEILKTVKKRKIKYLIIDLSKSKKFKQNSFAYIVILSCEVFENFFSIMKENDVNMNKLPTFIIPSQRIADAIRSKISNARCIVTFDPRNQAILDALAKGN